MYRTALLFAVLAAVYWSPTDGAITAKRHNWWTLAKKLIPNFDEFCVKAGGSCVAQAACKSDTNIVRRFCNEGKVCCIPKSNACEKILNGFCTTDKTACEAKPDHQFSLMKCSPTTRCCKPKKVTKKRKTPNHGPGHRGVHGLKSCFECFKENGIENCPQCPGFARRKFENGRENIGRFALKKWGSYMKKKRVQKKESMKKNVIPGVTDKDESSEAWVPTETEVTETETVENQPQPEGAKRKWKNQAAKRKWKKLAAKRLKLKKEKEESTD